MALFTSALLFCSYLLFGATTGWAEGHTLSALEDIIRKIENQRSQWTAFKADLALDFLTEGGHQASCRGELIYHRLDEKLILECFNTQNELLFAFKTDDRQFELFLPAYDTVFFGNIFELEDSLDIETHLKPLDLYRALKPMALFLRQASIENWSHDKIILRAYGKKHEGSYLARRMTTNHQGDVTKEIFYSFDEQPLVSIYRSNFQKFRLADSGSKKPITYPQQILIESDKTGQQTVLFLEKIHFFSRLENQDWSLTLPPNTQIIHLGS